MTKTHHFLLILLLGLAPAAWSGERVNLYSYHNHPPFVTGTRIGLTYELADYLNEKAAGAYRFEVKILPRARLNALLADWINGQCGQKDCANNWMVAWVNPRWGFIKGEQDPYAWHKLFDDSNSIISLAHKPIDYQGAQSLDGKTLLGMRGHRYVDIDARVAQGRMTRVDGNSERGNLLTLLAGRGDAALLPTSTINYYLTRDAELSRERDAFHVSATAHQVYTRFMMLPEARSDLSDLLRSAAIGNWVASESHHR